jgi:hypothetical protein
LRRTTAQCARRAPRESEECLQQQHLLRFCFFASPPAPSLLISFLNTTPLQMAFHEEEDADDEGSALLARCRVIISDRSPRSFLADISSDTFTKPLSTVDISLPCDAARSIAVYCGALLVPSLLILELASVLWTTMRAWISLDCLFGKPRPFWLTLSALALTSLPGNRASSWDLAPASPVYSAPTMRATW